MMPYLMRRVLTMIPTLLGITMLTFYMLQLVPGDPVQMKLMFADNALSADQLSAYLANQSHNDDLPEWYLALKWKITPYDSEFLVDHGDLTSLGESLHWVASTTIRYVRWLSHWIQGEWGRSTKDQLPVFGKIMQALPVTILINILTITIVYLMSVPLGVWSALNQGKWLERVVSLVLLVLYSMPGFWVAMMLLTYYAGGDYFDVFPLNGLTSDHFDVMPVWQQCVDVLWHLTLPVLTGVLGSLAFLSRFARNVVGEVINLDYVRTARAKGLPESTVMIKHVMRNVLIPFVTLLGSLLPGLIGGSVITEQIFGIPGIGRLSFEAMLGRDTNLIMALTVMSAVLTLVGVLISDLLYSVVDPRIRLTDQGARS